MIEVENNSMQGPQNLGLGVVGENGTIIFEVTNEDRDGEVILSFTVDSPMVIDSLIQEIKEAVEDAF